MVVAVFLRAPYEAILPLADRADDDASGGAANLESSSVDGGMGDDGGTEWGSRTEQMSGTGLSRTEKSIGDTRPGNRVSLSYSIELAYRRPDLRIDRVLLTDGDTLPRLTGPGDRITFKREGDFDDR